MSYFQSWINKDSSKLTEIFSADITYIECYGPEYQGVEMIKRWFHDWNQKGTVLQWDIKQFIHQDNVTAVEWYFKCEYMGNVSDFDGVSLIEFDQDNRIVNVKEFQSELPHYCPYE
ncbi:nuclear transport factor 2 family protein [Robertmurraya sp. FSL W8-0741]|uniref:nuclear transport factor 2 family protein n=1 Tax=Robertmurraya sp. FSL W8-0741 TaxID=2954629 RepID=UPI0030FA5AD8